MIGDAELAQLVAGGERDRIEFKVAAKDLDDIRPYLCAFANDFPNHQKPGYVIVGLKDDGGCAHTPINDKLLLRLGGIRSEGRILPFPEIAVDHRRIGDCEVAVIEVHPSLHPPVRLDGRVLIRVGPRLAQATLDEEQRLMERRRWKTLTFDRQPVASASIGDLDLGIFRESYLPRAIDADVLAENGRSTNQQLAALHFLTEGVPNHGAIVVFGRDPTVFVPGAYVQFARFDGTTLTDPIRAQHELRGPIPDVLRRLNDIFAANVSVAADLRSGPIEVKKPDYPIIALQQLAANAIMHRSYEGTASPTRISWFADRIEILSPGGLYGQMTPRNFGSPGVTDYRNPLIAEAMKVLGYVQRFGIGIALTKEAAAKNGNPPPEFEFDAGLLAILRRQP